jgi:hypothetical protein
MSSKATTAVDMESTFHVSEAIFINIRDDGNIRPRIGFSTKHRKVLGTIQSPTQWAFSIYK